MPPSLRLFAAGLVVSGLLASSPPSVARADAPPVIVASFSVLADIARHVVGPEADLRVLTPVGAEVHEWELGARNFVDLEDADIVFVNGYMLEQWMAQLEAVVGGDVPIVHVAEESGHSTLPIPFGGLEGEPDPHLWMDPAAAAAYARVVADRLAAIDTARAGDYAAAAADFGREMDALEGEIAQILSAVPPERRLLITSEAAFQYFAAAFGYEHWGIWGSNAEVEGTPEQMRRIIDIIHERRPAAVFWESTISDRYVRSVAEDTGVPVAGPLFVDSLGGPGSGAETYADMLRSNARLLVETLAVF